MYRLLIFFIKRIPASYAKDFLKAYFYYYSRIRSEPSLSGYLKRYSMRKGDIVVDAGAFRGSFALYAARRVGAEGKVIVFEPDERNCVILNRYLNAARIPNIIIVRKGLWSGAATLHFYVDQSGATSSLIKPENDDYTIQKVAVISLDEQLTSLGIDRINFIKMDIEGAEIEAIKGMERTLQRNNVSLAIATYHRIHGEQTCNSVERMLKELGYDAVTEYPQHLTTYAWKANRGRN